MIVDFQDARKGIRTDEFAFTVEVCGDHDAVRFFRKVFDAADDLFFLRQLFDGSEHEVRQGFHLPCAQLNAVGREGLFLFKRRFRQVVRHESRDRLPIGRDALPTFCLLVDERRREIGFKDMAFEAYGDPFLAVAFESIDRNGIDFVLLRFADS